MAWQQQHNNTRTDQLAPVLWVSWSRARCWHGDTVRISVRSIYVRDGGVLRLDIFPVGDAVAIDTVANLVINGNSLDHDYTVDWKTKVIPAGSRVFELTATLTNPATTSAASPPMWVDLEEPWFSA